MPIESFSRQPLATIIPSYLYFQYSDDPSLNAFVNAYNQITQSYLDWFNTTPLAVYTSPSISGALLDWIGQSIYGYSRPLLVTQSISGKAWGGYGFSVYGESPYGVRKAHITPGTAILVNDDIFKRALTWHLYIGDGKQMTMTWLKRRIARFLYGANGTDVSIDELLNVSIGFTSVSGSIGFYGTGFYGRVPYGVRKKTVATNKLMVITLPNIPISSTLALLINGGFLALPFQLKYQVNIS